MLEREIIWRLLTGPQSDTIRQIGLADSDLSLVNRAIGWIRDNYAEPMRIDDLARLSGMSPSGFHRHFRAVTAMSPLQFQKRIRLQEARLLLAARPGDIAGVGHLVGYDSPSQFNREYRRLFGSPPGQDAARMRTGASWNHVSRPAMRPSRRTTARCPRARRSIRTPGAMTAAAAQCAATQPIPTGARRSNSEWRPRRHHPGLLR